MMSMIMVMNECRRNTYLEKVCSVLEPDKGLNK